MSNLEMKFEGEKQGDHLELKRKDEETTEKNKPKKDLSLEIFEKMQKTFLDKMPEEERDAYQKFGEKFYRNIKIRSTSKIS